MLDDDSFPNIGGTGALHSLDAGPEPRARLVGLKSVSRAACEALARPAAPSARHPIGFHTGRRP